MSWVILSYQIEEEVTFLIHQQTLLQNLTEASLDRVLTLPKNLGKIIDGAFGLDSAELRGLHT